jgi:hypothetical protein
MLLRKLLIGKYIWISIGKISVFPLYINLKQSPEKQEIVFLYVKKAKKNPAEAELFFAFLETD